MAEHDPILRLLLIGIAVSAIVVLCVAAFLKTDGQTFQVFASLLSGFAGAFFTRIKPPSKPDGPAPPTGTPAP